MTFNFTLCRDNKFQNFKRSLLLSVVLTINLYIPTIHRSNPQHVISVAAQFSPLRNSSEFNTSSEEKNRARFFFVIRIFHLNESYEKLVDMSCVSRIRVSMNVEAEKKKLHYLFVCFSNIQSFQLFTNVFLFSFWVCSKKLDHWFQHSCRWKHHDGGVVVRASETQ